MAEAAKKIDAPDKSAALPQETTRKVIFHNLQDRDSKGNQLPIEFTFQGKYYALHSGREYELPEKLIEWLKSRKYPIFETRPDPDVPGNQTCVKVGEEARFALYLVQ